MKTNRNLIVILLLFALFTPSCGLFPEPQKPDYKAELEALLPNTQFVMAYFSGSDQSRFQLTWMQQQAGVRGIHGSVDRYNLIPDHVQETWDLYYRMIYPNLYMMLVHADNAGSKAYSGIAKVLLAHNIGLMTDAWGDIPNTTALNYSHNAFATYDKQSDIYPFALEMLASAVTDLEQALVSDGIKPGPAHDLIYGGNLQNWIKAANATSLRLMLRMAHQADNYNLVVPYLNRQLFSGNHEDMQYTFTGTQQNPFNFFDNTVRNLRMGKFFVDHLIATSDPRLPVFVRRNTQNNEFIGSAPGESNLNASFIGTAVAAEKAPIYLITFVEQKFIEAEVYHRTGQQTLADQAFETAVRASLQKYGVSNPQWESQHAAITNVSLEQIITAKYIALFLNPEVWSDFRRTGFPRITPFSSGTADPTAQIPRRLIYPTGEINHNAQNVPSGVTIFTRMWWDAPR